MRIFSILQPIPHSDVYHVKVSQFSSPWWHKLTIRCYSKPSKSIYYLIYHIVSVNTTYRFEYIATCFDLHKPSFWRAYEPWLFTICFCAFGIPDGLQFSYAYNVFLILLFLCVLGVCGHTHPKHTEILILKIHCMHTKTVSHLGSQMRKSRL